MSVYKGPRGGGVSWGGSRKCRANGCYEGTVTCQKCDARGIVAHKKCEGSGYFPLGTTRTCWGCNGLGDVTCNRCEGHGEYECKRCGGTGYEQN